MVDRQSGDHQVLVKHKATTVSPPKTVGLATAAQVGHCHLKPGHGPIPGAPATACPSSCRNLSAGLFSEPHHLWPQPGRAEPGRGPGPRDWGAFCPALATKAQAHGPVLCAPSSRSAPCQGWAGPGPGPPRTAGPGSPHPTVCLRRGWHPGSATARRWGPGHTPQQGAGVSCEASQ